MSLSEEIARKFNSQSAEEFIPQATQYSEDGYVEVPEESEFVRKIDKEIFVAQVVPVNDMLVQMVNMGGSDLFLSANSKPKIALHGSLVSLEEFPVMTGGTIKDSLYDILDERRRKAFEETHDLDTSHHINGVSRFRLNVFQSMGAVAAVFRAIPETIMNLKQLKMPPVLSEFCNYPRGLVLVTGPTGSGKSTTLAAMIDEINTNKQGHILTIEDPIEFVHAHKQCLVNQREIGADTESFSSALKSALREAPNYVLVGEMRDLETISLAISIAETGHLVFGTLHTQSSKDTISRLVDVFPANQQEQIRVQLASTLQAIVCQNLIKTPDGKGRVAAVEVLKINDAIKTKIRKNQLDSIVSDLQTGAQHGMQTMDQHLEQLVLNRIISVDAALDKAQRRADLIEELGGEAGVERWRQMVDSGSGKFVGLSRR